MKSEGKSVHNTQGLPLAAVLHDLSEAILMHDDKKAQLGLKESPTLYTAIHESDVHSMQGLPFTAVLHSWHSEVRREVCAQDARPPPRGRSA